MRDVLRWIDRHDGAPALEILASGTGEDAPATDLLAGIVATDSREQSGIWSTASGVLAAYRTEGALASTRAAPLDLDAFCAGPNTLYVCSTGRRQRQFAPLVVAIVGDVRDAAYARSRDGHAGPAHAARPRRGGQHRPHPRPAGHGQRGRRPGAAGAGLPAGPLPGPRPLGAGGRRLPLALRHHRGPARHRRHDDAARHRARWRATGRCATTTVSRSVDRWGRIRPSTSVGSTAPGPASRSTPWPTARPGRALVLGPDKEVPRSRSRRPTSARPGASSSRRRASSPPGARRARPLSQRPEPELRRQRARATRAGPAPRRAAARCGRGRPGGPPGSEARFGGGRHAERLGRARDAPAVPVGVERRRRVHATPRGRPGRPGAGPSARRWRFAGTTSGAGGAARPRRPARTAPIGPRGARRPGR